MKLYDYLRGKKLIITTAIIIIVAGVFYFTRGDDEKVYDTAIAKYDSITQEVDVTGKVKPAQSVDLAFEKGGRVSTVYAHVGESVFRGQTLVSLESGDVYASLLQSEANLQSAEAKLNELKKGTRPEEIAIQEAKIASAHSSLLDTEQSLFNELQNAFTKADDAIHNKADGLFSNPRTTSPIFNFSSINSQLKTTIETQRSAMEPVLTAWGNNLTNTELKVVKANLNQVKVLLDNIASAVNSLTPSSALSQTTIDGYKADISTARTNVNTVITSVATDEQAVVTAEYNLIAAQKQLDLQKAGATIEQIAAQEAAVRSADAQVANYKAQIGKTVISAPINGIITRQDARVGEIVSPGVAVVALTSKTEFEIESYIPEADIAGVAIGNIATFTLDAYENDLVFNATVIHIDPAETIIEGVSTYKVILSLAESDDRVKSGMTADVSILVDKRENVIAIPTRAINNTVDGKKIVRVLVGGLVEEREVTVGLRGSDGRTEIVSGIEDGDEVIVFEPK